MSTANRRFLNIIVISLVAAACIAETKLPPEPTVQYLPCSAMDLSGDRIDPSSVLGEPSLWGGFWTVGEEWHIGLTDPGEVDWDVACPEIGDSGLVVHDVPHSFVDLNDWNNLIILQRGPTVSVGSTVVNGQYVLEIRADDLAQANEAARGVPLTAWTYGGKAKMPIVE